jgi:hypothetical protein
VPGEPMAHPDVLNISLEVLNQIDFDYLRGTSIDFFEYLNNICELIKCVYYNNNLTLDIIKIDLMYIPHYYLKRLIGALPGKSAIKAIYHTKQKLLRDVLFFFDLLQIRIPDFILDKNLLIKNISKFSGFNFYDDTLYNINEKII